MPVASIDVTVILNGHREGLLIHRTFRSIQRAAEFAAEQGMRTEILVVLDRPDAATTNYFGRIEQAQPRILEVDFGDPALARNRGVEEAAGSYVAFVDGDDLVSRNWLVSAVQFAERHLHTGQPLVLHPELNVFFGTQSSILSHVDQDAPQWSLGSLFAANYWTALTIVRKEHLLAVPFRRSDPELGFGYEDWDWNILAIGAGMIHKVVPATWHFIRMKESGSRNRVAQDHDLLMRPSPVFDRLALTSATRLSPDSGECEGSDRIATGSLDRIRHIPGLLNEWTELAAIEPELFPTPDRLRGYSFWQPNQRDIGEAFGELLRQWGDAPSHVLLCDQFADVEVSRSTLNFVQALLDASADVLIVADRVRPVRVHYGGGGSLRVIDYRALSQHVGDYWRARILAQALIQRPPRVVHLIESAVGYQAVTAYGQAIRAVARLFVTAPGLGREADGAYASLAIRHFSRLCDGISGLLTSCQTVREWYCRTYAFPRELSRVVPSAVRPGAQFLSAVSKTHPLRPRALWIDDEGRPSCRALLLRIAALMPDWDFVVLTHPGDPEQQAGNAGPGLFSKPNVSAVPAGTSLPKALEGTQALLHTSLLDGLPDSFLDASVLGVPIVAPGLPGFREFLSEATGYPVADMHRPDAYAARLSQIRDEPDKAVKRVERAQRRVKRDHSWRRFVAALQAMDGYLV